MITLTIIFNIIAIIAIVRTLVLIKKEKDLNFTDAYFNLGFINHMIVWCFGILSFVFDVSLIIKYLP